MSASVNNAYAIPLYIAIGLALVFFVTIVVWFAICFFKNKNWLVCGIATTGLVVMLIVSGTVGQAMWLGEHERVKASVVGDATYIVQFDGKNLYRDQDQIFYNDPQKKTPSL